MICPRCSASNHDEERRCQKCGQRLMGDAPVPGAHPVTLTAAAPQMNPVEEWAASAPPPRFGPQAMPETGESHERRRTRREVARQVSLFALRDPQKIVAITGETAAPRSARSPGETHRKPAAVATAQGAFDFPDAEVDTVIFCTAHVASRTHRLLAALVDFNLIVLATVVFLVTFHLWGGRIVIGKSTFAFYAMIPVGLALLYEYIWCVAATDSPGMRWTGLRVIHFDGRPPTLRERRLRFIGWCLSLCSGIGLVWSYFDPESLTWHDHISRTFPTNDRDSNQ